MKTLLLALVMPPTGCAVLGLLGLLLALRWRRIGLALAWIGVVTVILLSLPVVSDNLLLALESGLPTTPSAAAPPRAIVVLGGEAVRSRSEPLGVFPGPLTFSRLRTAAALARRTGLPILTTGGAVQPDTLPIATIMAVSLRDDFREPTKWVEDQSRDTWENARLSAAILLPAGITSVYVVTSAWHMRRALLAFEGTGLTVTAAPTPLDNRLGPGPEDFLPHASAWLNGYYALHEWIGYEWYRIR
jgi:uncharacterized SAM-binding protein YcdF (DUF218 family)